MHAAIRQFFVGVVPHEISVFPLPLSLTAYITRLCVSYLFVKRQVLKCVCYIFFGGGRQSILGAAAPTTALAMCLLCGIKRTCFSARLSLVVTIHTAATAVTHLLITAASHRWHRRSREFFIGGLRINSRRRETKRDAVWAEIEGYSELSLSPAG